MMFSWMDEETRVVNPREVTGQTPSSGNRSQRVAPVAWVTPFRPLENYFSPGYDQGSILTGSYNWFPSSAVTPQIFILEREALVGDAANDLSTSASGCVAVSDCLLSQAQDLSQDLSQVDETGSNLLESNLFQFQDENREELFSDATNVAQTIDLDENSSSDHLIIDEDVGTEETSSESSSASDNGAEELQTGLAESVFIGFETEISKQNPTTSLKSNVILNDKNPEQESVLIQLEEPKPRTIHQMLPDPTTETQASSNKSSNDSQPSKMCLRSTAVTGRSSKLIKARKNYSNNNLKERARRDFIQAMFKELKSTLGLNDNDSKVRTLYEAITTIRALQEDLQIIQESWRVEFHKNQDLKRQLRLYEGGPAKTEIRLELWCMSPESN